MATDASINATVLYGGGIAPGSNQTWGYFFGAGGPAVWLNLTNASNSPPPLAFASMDFDPNVGQFVLFGGFDPGTFFTSNETWLLNPVGWGWTNDSTVACSLGCPAARVAAAMAFAGSSPDNATVLFGGCASASCAKLTNDTWVFGRVTTAYRWVPDLKAGGPTPRFGAAISDVAQGQSAERLVLFGGADSGSGAGINDTWAFHNGTWQNLSRAGSILSASPPGDVGGSLLYDRALGGSVLVGGLQAGSRDFAQTWEFSCQSLCNWTDLTNFSGGPTVTFAGASTSSDSSDPMLFGGEDVATGVISNSTWVLQNLTQIRPSVANASPELNQPDDLNITLVGGAVNGPRNDTPYVIWAGTFPNGSAIPPFPTSQLVTPAKFSIKGIWHITAYTDDQWDVSNVTTLLLSVGVPTVQAHASVTATDALASVTFSAVLGGTFTPASMNYTWSFGDGTTTTAASPLHRYARAGSFTVDLVVSDGLGNAAFSNISVDVSPAPSVEINPGVISATTGASVGFSATIANGTGPFTYSWSFGDGSPSNSSAAPSHIYERAGVPQVNLTVTDAVGVSAEANFTLAVFDPLVASARANASAAFTGSPIAFSVSAHGGTGIYSYTWQFGDGSTGKGAEVDHAYGTSGNFTATVWVNDSRADSVSYHVTVEITKFPGTPGGGKQGGSNGLAGAPSWLWPLIGVLLIAASVVGFWLTRRRSKGASPPSPWSEGIRPAGDPSAVSSGSVSGSTGPPPGAMGGPPESER